jgi:hypothetical protein
MCDTQVIEYMDGEEVLPPGEFKDWDDTMKTVRLVRPSELKKIMQERRIEEQKKKEEAEAAAAAAKGGKGAKKPAKPADVPQEEEVVVDMSEECNTELVDTIKPPEHRDAEGVEGL